MGKKPRAAGEQAAEPAAHPAGLRPFASYVAAALGADPGGAAEDRSADPDDEEGGDEAFFDDASTRRIMRLTQRLADAMALEQRRRRQLLAARDQVSRLERKIAALVPLPAGDSAVEAGTSDGVARPADAAPEDDRTNFLRLIAKEAAAAIRDSSVGDHSPTTRVGALRAEYARSEARGEARGQARDQRAREGRTTATPRRRTP